MVPGTKIEDSVNPSFAVELDGDPSNGAAFADPRTILIDGQTRGISGAMATGTYGFNADVYTLKIFDTSGQIYVNDGLNHPYQSQVLKRVLNRLGEALSPPIAAMGNTIIDSRPTAGYVDKAEVAKLFTTAQADLFINYITCHCWQDDSVANPVPLSNEASGAYWIPSIPAVGTPPMYLPRPTVSGVKLTRYGRNRIWDGNLNPAPTYFHGSGAGNSLTLGQSAVYGLDELNPRYIELTKRAPVNINTAPKPLLVALLQDLEGFFLVEQNRYIRTATSTNYYPALAGEWPRGPWLTMSNYQGFINHPYVRSEYWNPPTPQQYHTTGEIGLLYRTTPVSATTAGSIADAILTRRATAAFSGWEDFNRFVDGLVGTTIVDPRPATAFAVYPGAVANTFYTDYAAQAIADTIKSNFNPNLHLNELNPDLAINMLVDKTDLIQASTEFCFAPTGTYEIESLGQVLMPSGTLDAFTAVDNRVAGQTKARAIVKLFDVYRESAQKHFYEGTLSANTSGTPTYMNKALQIGPEPDNGPAPTQTDYEGYVMLATFGGSLAAGATHSPGTLQASPTGTAGTTEGMSALVHGHFDFDYRLHVSTAAGKHETLTKAGPWPGLAPINWNHKDRTEGTQTWEPPYCSAYDTDLYRIAKSYKWTGSSLVVPTLTAPPDLRIDGAYSEKSSAPMYHSLDGNFNPTRGIASYWLKPAYEPEFVGKPRMYFNLDGGGSDMWNRVRTVLHVMHPGVQGTTHEYNTSGYLCQRSSSFAFGLTAYTGSTTSANGNTPGRMSLLASHLSHTHPSPVVAKSRQLAGRHLWTHVALSWHYSGNDPSVPTTGTPLVRIYVNGTDPTEGSSYRSLNASWWAGSWPTTYPDCQSNMDMRSPRQMVPIRLGAHPHWSNITSRTALSRNYPADSTIDELYVWGTSYQDATAWNKAMGQFSLGRYYRENDGVFTSKSITLAPAVSRTFPPATSATPPAPTGEGGGGAGQSVTLPGSGASSVRVLGMAWTVYGVVPAGTYGPTACTLPVYRYSTMNYLPLSSNTEPTYLTQVVSAEISMDDGETWQPPMNNPAWGAVQLGATPGVPIKYRISFDSGGDPLNSVLLSSPILDDVTIYYETEVTWLQLSMNTW